MLKQFQSVNAAAANGPHAELNIQELRVVEFLGDEGPHIMRELATFLNVAVNSVTSIVDNLEKKGLVRRVRSEEDRRIIRVELTDAGRLIHQDALDVNMQLFRTMLRALSSEEQKIFLLLIRKIVPRRPHAGLQARHFCFNSGTVMKEAIAIQLRTQEQRPIRGEYCPTGGHDGSGCHATWQAALGGCCFRRRRGRHLVVQLTERHPRNIAATCRDRSRCQRHRRHG